MIAKRLISAASRSLGDVIEVIRVFAEATYQVSVGRFNQSVPHVQEKPNEPKMRNLGGMIRGVKTTGSNGGVKIDESGRKGDESTQRARNDVEKSCDRRLKCGEASGCRLDRVGQLPSS